MAFDTATLVAYRSAPNTLFVSTFHTGATTAPTVTVSPEVSVKTVASSALATAGWNVRATASDPVADRVSTT